MSDAAAAFSAAVTAEPENAVYQYHLALAEYDVHGAEAAADTLAKAVEAERAAPVKDWGRRMERVQGKNRVWVEKARREAGLVR